MTNLDPSRDVELADLPTNHLANSTVKSFSWSSLSVTVKSRATKQPLRILDDVAGIVQAGEMLAIMGPSGSGKTTLLNALAHRVAAAGAVTTGDVTVNGTAATRQVIRDLSTYVEQEDALIGSLTVRETMTFAARLALPR
jgi:ABC-type multidrug transport system ATPase subunit